VTASAAHVSSQSRLRVAAQGVATPFIVAITYYLGAEAAFAIGTLSDRIFAPFWPPNIVLLCALLLNEPRRWWIVIMAALPAHVIAETGVGMPPDQYVIAFVTNCMVAILSAVGIRQFVGGPPWFVTLRQGFLYVAIAVFAGPAVSAFGGALVRIAGGGAVTSYWTYWAQWFASNALTAVTLGPLFLIALGDGARASIFEGSRKLEAALLLLALVAACMITFGIDPARLSTGFLPTLFYLPIPLIVWGAVRFGALGASGAILVVAIVSIERNLQGAPLFTGANPEENVLELQVYLTALSVPALLLGAAIEELQRARGTMQELAGAVLRSHDDERRRVARDLHDKVAQDLAAANLVMARLDRQAPPQLISELEAIHRRVVHEIRAVSYLLHPPLLDEAGLALALKSYVGGLAQRSGVDVDLALSPDLERLPREVEFVLFRVIQDAVTNVHRHSGSPQARIALTLTRQKDEQTVMLMIEDIGDAETSPRARHAGELAAPDLGGIGLAAMRERLRRIDGRISVESRLGRTLVTAVIPLAN
jgi:signal transduction histidine kinase